MAYENSGNWLQYFIPNIPLADGTAGVLEEVDIGATGADHGEYICIKPCIMRRTQFTMVGELAGGTSAAPTVLFKKRPTPLSATGETTVSTLTIPDATGVGATIFEEVNTAFAVGDSVEISHTVGTGTPTGKGFPSALCTENPEVASNNTELTVTA